jgi:hypothetical protein
MENAMAVLRTCPEYTKLTDDDLANLVRSLMGK